MVDTNDYLATRYLDPDQQRVVVQTPVADIETFLRVLDVIRENKPDEVVLFVERGPESFFFAVKP